MAILEVKIPKLSESVSEATLLQWHKKAGEQVTLDENLVDIETDKVVLELPSPGTGILISVLKKDGDKVVSDEVIATVDTAASIAESPAVSHVSGQKATAAASFDSERDMPEPENYPSGIVMPAAARLLSELGMDESSVSGTGKDGRVTKADVQQAWEAQQTLPANVQDVFGKLVKEKVGVQADRMETRVPMSRLRARVAERLIQSQQSTASLTTFNEVNMQPVLDLRKKFGEQFEKEHGIRLGLMSFFVKAVVAALKRFPVVNASIDGNDIVYHAYYDIGIAVSSPRGLVVPILRNADLMSIAEIEKSIDTLSVKAREGQLTLDDLVGGTFSISNGGIFGSMLSTPIINPPQSAILGIHATKERPVVENGQIVIRPMNYLALSYDHRLIDGREAVLALRTIKETLEDPARLLLDL